MHQHNLFVLFLENGCVNRQRFVYGCSLVVLKNSFPSPYFYVGVHLRHVGLLDQRLNSQNPCFSLRGQGFESCHRQYTVGYCLLVYWENNILEFLISFSFITSYLGCAHFSCCQVWIHKKCRWGCWFPELHHMRWDAYCSTGPSLRFSIQRVRWCQYWWLPRVYREPCTCFEIKWLLPWHRTPGESFNLFIFLLLGFQEDYTSFHATQPALVTLSFSLLFWG